MAVGLAELVILSLLVDFLFRKVRVPGLVGMLGVGIVLGPYVLGYLDSSLLSVSSDLRMIALIVILLRAGFELSIQTLRRIGFRAMLLSCVPAICEGVAATFLGVWLLGLSYMESALLGAVLAAVSPAVVVPLMISFMDRRMGTSKGLPQLVLAASSIDDVFVIVVYSSLIGFYTGTKVNVAWKLAGIPVSIVAGIALGVLVGWLLHRMFVRFNPRATKRVLVILGISVVLVTLEPLTEGFLPFAALLSVMAMGTIILKKNEYMAHEISARLAKIWVFAEILLFTLVGSQVDIHVAWRAGLAGSALIGLALVARSAGTYLCLLGSEFTQGERLFVVISYVPKATVQAAIGGAPLLAMRAAGMNTLPGEVILAVAVLSILLTAPLGAWAISLLGRRVLKAEEPAGAAAEDDAPSVEALARRLRVAEAMNPDIVAFRQDQPLRSVLETFTRSEFSACPVVDSRDALVGILRLEDLRPILLSRHAWEALIAHDAARPVETPPHPSDSLADALDAMRSAGMGEVPVVEPGTGRVVGLLDERQARRYLEERWLASRAARGDEADGGASGGKRSL